MAATDSSVGEGNINREEVVVHMLQRLKPKSLTMQGLEKAYMECQNSDSHIPMVFLADIVSRIVNMDLEDFCIELENSLEMLAEETCNVGKGEKEEEDVYIQSVVEWVFVATEAPPPIELSILRRFLKLGYTLAHAYRDPCNGLLGMGPDALLIWAELQDAASTFMAVCRPCIADALSVIHCLRRKPVLNCIGLSAVENANLKKFDRKWENLCNLYPIVNMLADPALVVVEPIAGAGLPPQVVDVAAAITTSSNSPLPSGGAPPLQVNDVVGNFTNLFQMPSMDDARTFAAMLRGQMADAAGGGGVGPTLRILTLNAPAGSMRLY